MKRFAIASLLLFAAARAEAADYTDIWYNAAQSGYGFNIVESDDGTGAPFLFVTFFIYGASGAPTWYTATLRWNGADAFTGTVFATTGTFFGAPWNSAAFSALPAGTATFRPSSSNNYEATLAYTVTGVGSSTTAVTRQTLTAIATGGTYVGGQSGIFSGCNSRANNAAYTDYYDLQVTHGSAGSVQYAFAFRSGLTCGLAGTYSQNGQYLSVANASYTCSDGTTTTAQMSEIKATALGIEGRFVATGGFDNCRESASFGGPKVR